MIASGMVSRIALSAKEHSKSLGTAESPFGTMIASPTF
jgi:hypothetical protein